MEEKIIQYVEKDKELQKHILKMHLKSDDMLASYYILGFFLFFEILFVVVFPKVLIPVITAELLIEIYLMFRKNYTVDEYEVKKVYDNVISSKLKYYECVLAKPGNKKVDGFIDGKIIKSRNENIRIGDRVLAIKAGKEYIVTKYNG